MPPYCYSYNTTRTLIFVYLPGYMFTELKRCVVGLMFSISDSRSYRDSFLEASSNPERMLEPLYQVG